MENIEINNNVKINELYDNKTWIHGISKENIKITIFLITICSDQLKYSLDAINKLDKNISVLINVIMNIKPTSKAYNEMRVRCKTDFFIQNDEDMELFNNSLVIFDNIIKNSKSKYFLYSFKLIDNILGIGSPPIIDCIKLYKNKIIKKYPINTDLKNIVSSVDYFWHQPALKDGYKSKDTKIKIGYHGKHRSDFDLMLRQCKILKSIIDSNIKTNSGHICKLLRSLNKKSENLIDYFYIIINHFIFFTEVNFLKLNKIINNVNNYVPSKNLNAYGIKNRVIIPELKKQYNFEIFFSLFNKKDINKETFYSVLAILCIATDNYEYSYDKYPFKIYNYFDELINNKKEILLLDNKEILYEKNKHIFILSDNNYIKYDFEKKFYIINRKFKNHLNL
jgi:hypothetical protein